MKLESRKKKSIDKTAKPELIEKNEEIKNFKGKMKFDLIFISQSRMFCCGYEKND